MLSKVFDLLLTLPAWLWRRHERAVLCAGGDKISTIVITRQVEPGSILKCEYDGQWYGLIAPADWEALPNPPQGVTVVTDDELAQRILAG